MHDSLVKLFPDLTDKKNHTSRRYLHSPSQQAVKDPDGAGVEVPGPRHQLQPGAELVQQFYQQPGPGRKEGAFTMKSQEFKYIFCERRGEYEIMKLWLKFYIKYLSFI